MHLSVFFIVQLAVFSLAAKKPDEFFQLCRRGDPQLNQCLLDVIMKARPTISAGIPEIGLKPFEPMRVQEVSMKGQKGSPVSLEITFKNVELRGISQYTIINVTADPENMKIELEAKIPKLDTKAGYKMDGKVLLLPVKGEGNVTGVYTGLTYKVLLEFEPTTIKNKIHWKNKSAKSDVKIEKALFDFKNLFNGNQELGDTFNKFGSENWDLIFTEMKPLVEEMINAILSDIVNRIFLAFPIDKLFPE